MKKRALLLLSFSGFCLHLLQTANAQVSADFSNGGSVIVGYDSRACSNLIEGAIRYNSGNSKIQFCQSITNANCGPAGTTCVDGTVYVGPSPDNGDAMYTTSSDAPSVLPWNYMGITGDYTNTSMVDCSGFQVSCNTGQSNTDILASEDSNSNLAGTQDHEAAQYCYDLSSNGHTDWYLPAESELELMYAERNSGDLSGTFKDSPFSERVYWSSSENDLDSVRYVDFGTGSTANRDKNNDHSVRCTRKSSTPVESVSFQWANWGE